MDDAILTLITEIETVTTFLKNRMYRARSFYNSTIIGSTSTANTKQDQDDATPTIKKIS